MHEQSLAENHPVQPTPRCETPINPFATMLANMPPDDVRTMLDILSRGRNFNSQAFSELFKNTNPGYHQLLSAYEINYLGGGNCKNYQFTSRTSPNPTSFVVRVDDRLGGAREMDTFLRTSNLKDIVTPIEAARSVTFNGQTKTLLITSVCPGGTPEAHSKRCLTIEDRLKGALDIYSQMATLLLRIDQEDILFPDAKNSNWLLNAEGKLLISDTKSLVFSDEGYHDYDCMYEKNKWIFGSVPRLITTWTHNPPEINNQRFDVDTMHSFILGKNMYQYLTQCTNDELLNKQNADSLDFTKPIFKTREGLALKTLIKKLVVYNPSHRILVSTAVNELNHLKNHLMSEDTIERKCRGILQNLETNLNIKDYEMKRFIGDTSKFITNATPEELTQRYKYLLKIKQEQTITYKFLEATQAQINNSKFKTGGDRKIIAIQNALYSIPVAQRGHIMDGEHTPSKEIKLLHAALGTWRTFFGNFAPYLPSCSSIYQKYNKLYEKIKKENAFPDENPIDQNDHRQSNRGQS